MLVKFPRMVICKNQDRSPSLAEAEELNQYKMFRSSSKKYFFIENEVP